MQPTEKAYWAEYVIALRKGLNLSQGDLALQLGTNQCSVSRWEQGVAMPSYEMRGKLASLRSALLSGGLFTKDVIGNIAQKVLNASSSTSMLLHFDGTILAVSPGSEYIPGGKLIDQTLPEEMDEYRNLEGFFERMEFWDTLNACFEYRYQSRNEDRYAIITSIQIEAVTCCLIENKLQP